MGHAEAKAHNRSWVWMGAAPKEILMLTFLLMADGWLADAEVSVRVVRHPDMWPRCAQGDRQTFVDLIRHLHSHISNGDGGLGKEYLGCWRTGTGPSTEVEHALRGEKIDPLGPCQGGAHAHAMHSTSEGATVLLRFM